MFSSNCVRAMSAAIYAGNNSRSMVSRSLSLLARTWLGALAKPQATHLYFHTAKPVFSYSFNLEPFVAVFESNLFAFLQ
jgi:hypothetical protein